MNLDPLQKIPGVGKSIAKDLKSIGIKKIEDLKGKNPEIMYKALMNRVGAHVDRCVLYVFRCAVYFAETKNPRQELLKWWNWKDRNGS